MRISQAAFDLIVEQEITSKAVYEKRYRRPEWPGGASGITIGIGYDVGAGVSNRAQLDGDWKDKIPDPMIDALARGIGVTGESAQRLLPLIKNLVDVPWDAAIDVFTNRDIPKWTDIVCRALPNTDKLSPDCLGALVSLAYNRGPSFSKDGDRYIEMRAIKDHMAAGEFSKIPDEFRRMKRLWGANLSGLLERRDAEAALFARGLASAQNAGSRRGTVISRGLNMRAGASVSFGIVETLSKDTTVTITGEQMSGPTKWFGVTAPSGKSGWVVARFVVQE